MIKSTLRTLAIAGICSSMLSACLPLVAGGIGTGVSSTLDRRTYSTQIDDQQIEVRVMKQLNDRLDEKVQISTTAFNHWVLLTGQATTDEYRAEAEKYARTTSGVRQVFNEVTVGWPATAGTHGRDALTTSKVKARLFDTETRGISGHHVKVVTESGIVYLMGIVSEAEANIAIEIARTTTGVNKVVNLFEVLSDEEIRKLSQPPEKGPAPVVSPPRS